MRRLICILLMFWLPLQGFAAQWSPAIQTENGSTTHKLLHDSHVSHHHEDDGSIHFDTSDESVRHIQDHSCSPQPCGLFTPELIPAPNELVETIAVHWTVFIPDPALEIPHRPPAPALG